MSADWAQLKAKRAGRTGEAPVASPSDLTPSSPQAPLTSLSAQGVSKVTEQPSNRLEYSHPDLPSSLSVRTVPGKGRGIVAEDSFTPGSTLLSTTPLISVLDQRNIFQRCSACYRLSEDTAAQKPLLQCSRCHIVQYCSGACQQQDWYLHKSECKAMRNMSALAKEKGEKPRGGQYVPETPVRAIGRLLWKKQLEGDSYWKQVMSLQAHRGERNEKEQKNLFRLLSAVSAYVGQDFLVKAVQDASNLIDLISRFTSNSFSLTSPTDLTNIGVSISPLTALFNHSCRPNSVVVFPIFPSPSCSSSKPNPSSSYPPTTKNMRVVAIRPIKPGEEVLTSYVDLASPKETRQRELLERYKFECRCEECERKDVDPREAFACPKGECRGLLRIIDGGGESACSVCGGIVDVPDVKAALDAAKSRFEEAEKTQYTDPAASETNLLKLISSLIFISPSLSPSSHPLFQAYSLLLTLHLHDHKFNLARRMALPAWTGACELYPYGHPVRAILSTTMARLVSIPPQNPSPQEDLQYWSDIGKRSNGLRMMVESLKQCEIGFGKKDGGGQVGSKLRQLIRDQEEGIEMGRRVARGV
ncbi:uncharacterized protein JCM6883_000528 [Sporobolomyces salmoneus]|uniref:uncharacterized protein n=1 Tax=Sporobolomyces salmoneus TaxID=183962 RepID=UPI003177414B